MKNKENAGNGIKFLIIVVFTFLLVLLFNPGKAILAFSDFFTILSKVLPLLMIVFLAMIAVNMFLTEEKIKKHIGKETGIKGMFYATIAGILVSGPPYVLYPMLGELKEKGVNNFYLAIFLYNRNVKIPFIPALIFYFGPIYTIVLSFYIILFSFLNGFIVSRFAK